MMRVRRRGFPRDTRRGSTIRLIDQAALSAVRFVPYVIPIPSPHRIWKHYTVVRRSARFLYLEPAA